MTEMNNDKKISLVVYSSGPKFPLNNDDVTHNHNLQVTQ